MEGPGQVSSSYDSLLDAREAAGADGSTLTATFLYVFSGLFVTAVVWANFAELEEVTRGEGTVIPSLRAQVVQSLEGGIIRSLAVREGQQVRKGQVLATIDDTGFSSDLGELQAKEIGLAAKIARLRHEASGVVEAGDLEFPSALAARAPEVIQEETKLFEMRRNTSDNQLEILEERLTQRRQELAELVETRARFETNVDLATQELDLKRPLADRGIVSKTEILKQEREVADLRGQLAATLQSIPKVEAAIREAQRSIEEQTLMFRQNAQAELSSAIAENSVIAESLTAARDRVARAEIRAPVDGVVNTVHVNTIGGVVRAGEPIFEITPVDEKLFVEVRIDPKDVAFITPGQRSSVKLSAYDYTIYGVLDGQVAFVSPDSQVEESTGRRYYLVNIEIASKSLESGKELLPILPGMVATADIITGKKSVLDYLLKPIIKARNEALRER